MTDLRDADGCATGPGLRIEVVIDGDCVVVALRDEIDMSNAELLPTVVASAVNGDASVRIDLSRVTFLDSSGLRAILACEALLAREGTTLRVVNATDQSRRIFEICGLSYLLE